MPLLRLMQTTRHLEIKTLLPAARHLCTALMPLAHGVAPIPLGASPVTAPSPDGFRRAMSGLFVFDFIDFELRIASLASLPA